MHAEAEPSRFRDPACNNSDNPTRGHGDNSLGSGREGEDAGGAVETGREECKGVLTSQTP